MHEILGNSEEILCRLGGFHQYVLTDPPRLAYVTPDFCGMLGYSQNELLAEDDVYSRLIHPDDRETYAKHLRRAAKEPVVETQYRVVKKDGSILYVNDRMFTVRLEDGILVGNATLTDVTKMKTENQSLRFLNDTISCGLLKYTCEKNPRITYVNEHLLRFLKFPEDGEVDRETLEMTRSNIYLMIPMEERRRFAQFLESVREKGAPIAGEMTVMGFDGSRVRLYGWVTKTVNARGQEEFQSVCMDVTERYKRKKAAETERYLETLSEVYDRIFEYDFAQKTVKCLYERDSDDFRLVRNVPMDLRDATERFIESGVYADDREKVRSFFEDIFARNAFPADNRPPQVSYHAVTAGGVVRSCTGIFLKIDASVNYFCCRNVAQEPHAEKLRNENASLRNMNENMQELVMRFTDGIVAFEIEGDAVKPLYASDNVCRFFGYTTEEWVHMAQAGQPIQEFVSKSGVGYQKFQELLERGEAEFEYVDVDTNETRRIKSVCSNVLSDGIQKQYVMLYNVGDGAPNAWNAREKSRVYVRTFGYFDVFVDDKPIAFRNEKSKELFALLVDRKGGYVSADEAISFLWEDEPTSPVTLARYRKVALRLKNILEEYGISDVVESVNGRRRLVTEKVRCDLYEYLYQGQEHSQLFKGTYLSNYSWGETTLGELLGDHAF